MSMLDMLGSGQATGRSTGGRTPIFRMTLSGVPLDVTVQDCTITTGENMHDTCSMTLTSATLTTINGILDSPISFLYGSAPRTEVFCGYVTGVTEQQSDTGVLTFVIEVTGPTKLLQTGVPRFWPNRTVPSAVETLSYGSYLGYTGHAHTYIWNALAQTDASDWQTAVSLARRIGWSVFNRYGIVMLYDPLQLFVSQGVAATLISETYTLAKTAVDSERSLLEFEPAEEAESSTTQQGLKVAYFNSDGLQVALQKGKHTNYRFLNDFVIRNAEEAALYVNAADSDSSNWQQTAKARIMGNATLFAGQSVEILTTNTKFYPGKFNGRWLVRGIQHKMDRQSFQSNVMLARPVAEGAKIQVSTDAYAPFWQSIGRAKPTLSLNQTATLPTPVRALGLTSDVIPGDWNGSGPIYTIPERETPTTANPSGVWVSSWTNPTVRSIL